MDAIALISHQVLSRKAQDAVCACAPAVLRNITTRSQITQRLNTTILLSAALLILVACASTPPVQEQQASYIIQGKDLITVTNAVRSVGGEITHELGIIRAVGAELTPSQADRLRKIEGLRLHENHSVETATTTSPTSGTVRDEFRFKSYSGNDGTVQWSTNWQEMGESDGPTSGTLEVEDSAYLWNDGLIEPASINVWVPPGVMS